MVKRFTHSYIKLCFSLFQNELDIILHILDIGY